MSSFTISKLARLFGLSRSTLLYYDRIGLLSPPGRTSTGYRIYSEEDAQRLDRICTLRRTSLSIDDIKTILRSEDRPCVHLFEKRLKEIEEEILSLKAKQGLLCAMLKGMAEQREKQDVDRDMWVEMLRAAGMDEQGMDRWHAEFEHRAPEAHHEFLLSLGIPEDEALAIRQWARKLNPAGSLEDA
ncbi:MAG: MerR family transcriptional regulator [Desulfobacteraceae bacterium]|nr:MerR family transcriptional regulator [Desulfobacteraceae bacterium]